MDTTVSSKSRGRKPWYKSGAIKGALVAGLSAALSPAVLGLLPEKYAALGVIVGAVWSQIGVRKAIQ